MDPNAPVSCNFLSKMWVLATADQIMQRRKIYTKNATGEITSSVVELIGLNTSI